jgi:hypothetical protein
MPNAASLGIYVVQMTLVRRPDTLVVVQKDRVAGPHRNAVPMKAAPRRFPHAASSPDIVTLVMVAAMVRDRATVRKTDGCAVVAESVVIQLALWARGVVEMLRVHPKRKWEKELPSLVPR